MSAAERTYPDGPDWAPLIRDLQTAGLDASHVHDEDTDYVSMPINGAGDYLEIEHYDPRFRLPVYEVWARAYDRTNGLADEEQIAICRTTEEVVAGVRAFLAREAEVAEAEWRSYEDVPEDPWLDPDITDEPPF